MICNKCGHEKLGNCYQFVRYNGREEVSTIALYGLQVLKVPNLQPWIIEGSKYDVVDEPTVALCSDCDHSIRHAAVTKRRRLARVYFALLVLTGAYVFLVSLMWEYIGAAPIVLESILWLLVLATGLVGVFSSGGIIKAEKESEIAILKWCKSKLTVPPETEEFGKGRIASKVRWESSMSLLIPREIESSWESDIEVCSICGGESQTQQSSNVVAIKWRAKRGNTELHLWRAVIANTKNICTSCVDAARQEYRKEYYAWLIPLFVMAACFDGSIGVTQSFGQEYPFSMVLVVMLYMYGIIATLFFLVMGLAFVYEMMSSKSHVKLLSVGEQRMAAHFDNEEFAVIGREQWEEMDDGVDKLVP